VLVAVVAQVDAVVHLVVAHGSVVGYVLPPLVLAADQVVALPFEEILAAHGGVVVGSAQVEPDGIAASVAAQADDRVTIGEPDGVAGAAREEVDLRVGLPGVDLEGERSADDDRLGRRRAGGGQVQQAGELTLRGGVHCKAGLDQAQLELQIPVAAQFGCAGRVFAGRHIGAGQARQRLQQRAALLGAGDVATVDQQVGLFGERTTPALDLGGVGEQGIEVERGAAQLHRTGLAVGEDVDGVDPAASGERLADLLDAVALRIEHHDLELAIAGLGQEVADDSVDPWNSAV
jgi:hypothetical protein